MIGAALISELEDAVATGSPERRIDILRRVTHLFVVDSERLSEDQIRVFDSVLVHLIQKIEAKVLAQLSTSLAKLKSAPPEVVRRLARDDNIAVAWPVLANSVRLSQEDIIEIAQAKGQSHLLAISGRTSLSPAVTDVLIRRGDSQVAHALARNSGARFSESGFAALVKKAEGDGGLAELLGVRVDIPPSLFMRLVERASEEVRARLIASAPPNLQKQIQSAVVDVVDDVKRSLNEAQNYDDARLSVEALNRSGKLNDQTVFGFAVDRRQKELTAALATMCGTSLDGMESLINNGSNDGVVFACKAANLRWDTAAMILKSRAAGGQSSDRAFEAERKAFEEITTGAAQRTVRFWHARSLTNKNVSLAR